MSQNLPKNHKRPYDHAVSGFQISGEDDSSYREWYSHKWEPVEVEHHFESFLSESFDQCFCFRISQLVFADTKIEK